MSGEKECQPVYFTQEDPIGLAGGMNLYGYGAGDPINNSDPMGLSPQSERDRAEAQDQARNDQWVGCKGDQLCNDVWNYWVGRKGGTMYLTDAQMGHVANVAKGPGASSKAIGMEDWNGHEAITTSVSFYGTALGAAFGVATVLYDRNGLAIGFRDNFDFNKRDWFGENSRPKCLGFIPCQEMFTRGRRTLAPSNAK